MALFLGSSLARGGVFSLSDAEAAFHPWWQTVQDYSVYSMILVGLFAIPTSNNELECSTVDSGQTAPAHNAYVNGFCTRENLSLFHSYFPYIVAMGPTLLILVHKFFTKASSGGRKQVRFYSLLVEDTLSADSLDDLRRESRRDIREMRNAFKGSKSFLVAFWLNSLIKLVLSTCFGLWIVFSSYQKIWSFPEGIAHGFTYVNYMSCSLKDVSFTCLIPHTHFYLCILLFAASLDLVYVLSAAYACLWLAFPRLRRLAGHLREYRASVARLHSSRDRFDDGESVARSLDVYGGLRSPDVEILLDLLAESEGVAPAMRILTLLDQEFHMEWKTQGLQRDNAVGSTHAEITFSGAEVGRHLRKRAARKILYAASLDPRPEGEMPVQNFVDGEETSYDEERAFSAVGNGGGGDHGSAINKSGRKSGRRRRPDYTVRYTGLDPGTAYEFRVATTFRGKEVAESVTRFVTRPVPPSALTSVTWGFDVSGGGDDDGGGGLSYAADISWAATSSAGSAVQGFVAEVEDGAMTLKEEVGPEARLVYRTDGASSPVRIRIWSVAAGGLRSEDALYATLPPVPQYMRDYARNLERVLPRAEIGSRYLFKIGLMRQVTRELRDLYAEVQDAACMARDADMEDDVGGGGGGGLPDVD